MVAAAGTDGVRRSRPVQPARTAAASHRAPGRRSAAGAVAARPLGNPPAQGRTAAPGARRPQWVPWPADRRLMGARQMDAAEIFGALLEPAGRTDPFPLYAALNELGEAVAADGVVLVSGFDAANAVLRDPAFRVADAARFDEIMPRWRDHPAMLMNSLLSLNPPE